MRKTTLSSLIILFIFLFGCTNLEKNLNNNNFQPLDDLTAQLKADSVLALMTLDEKIAYVGGDSIFFIRGIERLGLPSVYFTDATQGIHIRGKFDEYDLSNYAMDKSTAFPCAISLAATWNENLSYQYAKSIGEECRAGGIGVLLGPGMNIYRNSQCGRNFEYFGEDPYLAGRMIYNYVQGVQSTGTVATIKHFIANNTDFFRRKSNSIVDERTLHEIYMPAFKAGVDAGAAAAMTSYNMLNGEYCGQSDFVINHLLKGELGFKGMVMTDWWSVDNGEKLSRSGQDLEMPYAIALKNAKQLIDDGTVSVSDIDRMTKSILKLCFKMKLFDREKEPKYYDTFPNHVQTALNTAREGIVLLRNERNILPIKDDINNILITGDYVKELLGGGGSGIVKGYDIVTMFDALKSEFGERIEFAANPTDEQIKNAQIVLCNVGTKDSEGYDRPFELPADQEEKIQRCAKLNSNTVVIISTGSGIKMTDWNEKVAAILYSWYPGQIGNVALAEILIGKTNPSGKLPMTIERDFKDSPANGYMNGEEFYTGWNSEGEKAHPMYDINYKEGIFVGYRWFEKKKIEPLYPFGFGLSYTNFELTDIKMSSETISPNGELTVSLKIKNTGNIGGAEVIQLYIEDESSTFERPIKELKHFNKVFLGPSQVKKISFNIDKKDLQFWSPKTKEWTAEKGKFRLHLGNSSKNILASKQFELL